MQHDSDLDDLVSAADPNESDFFSSGSEYEPGEGPSSGSDFDGEPVVKKKKGPTRCNSKTRKERRTICEGDSDDEDMPLARLQTLLKDRREEESQQVDADIVSKILEEPMWAHMPFSPVDAAFSGASESPPDNLKTPYQYFTELITDEMIEKIELETNNYALAKGGVELKVTSKEIKTFIALYLRMGLMKGYCLRAYWALETRYPPVADFMTRNRFLKICRFIHFQDNEKPDNNDRVWKIRSWIAQLQQNLEKIPPGEHQSVDEIMVAFKGKSTLKQYIRNKPHKWGLKLWARAGSEGILHDFDVYQGSASAGTNRSELGVSGDVVMNMTKKLEEGKGFKVYADNLFSSPPLVKKLKEKGIWYTGTVRENRLKGCHLKPEKEMKKQGRGDMDSLVDVDANIVALRWYDNKKVDVISSFVGEEPVTSVSRWDKKGKKKVDVPCPAAIHQYNKNMGGVDLLDSLTALYKAKIKTRRWYIYIFYHSINMVLVTSWLWYRRHCKLLDETEMKLSSFLDQVASALILVDKKKPGRPSLESPNPTTGSAKSACEQLPTVDVRLDGIDHRPLWGGRQTCKKPTCKEKSFVYCSKCKVHLCLNKSRNCFDDVHTKATF